MSELRRHPEPVSVVVCTSGRPKRLATTLASLAALDYPDFEVVLVENGKGDSGSRAVLETFQSKMAVRYVTEPIPGLARARNTGLRSARHDFVAFTDDDVIVDRQWLWGIRLGLGHSSTTAAVSGPVLPAELVTRAQELFERQGGHSKGRGFRRALLGAGDEQDPLFPLPPFGVGANMGFRRYAIEAVGGFDVALGAGTPSLAGEDTAVLSEIMLRGWNCAYEPAAVTWHFHRRTLSELKTQRHNYGVGLGAYYTAVVVRDPRRIWRLVKLSPRAWRAMRMRASLAKRVRMTPSVQPSIAERSCPDRPRTSALCVAHGA